MPGPVTVCCRSLLSYCALLVAECGVDSSYTDVDYSLGLMESAVRTHYSSTHRFAGLGFPVSSARLCISTSLFVRVGVCVALCDPSSSVLIYNVRHKSFAPWTTNSVFPFRPDPVCPDLRPRTARSRSVNVARKRCRPVRRYPAHL